MASRHDAVASERSIFSKTHDYNNKIIIIVIRIGTYVRVHCDTENSFIYYIKEFSVSR